MKKRNLLQDKYKYAELLNQIQIENLQNMEFCTNGTRSELVISKDL